MVVSQYVSYVSYVQFGSYTAPVPIMTNAVLLKMDCEFFPGAFSLGGRRPMFIAGHLCRPVHALQRSNSNNEL